MNHTALIIGSIIEEDIEPVVDLLQHLSMYRPRTVDQLFSNHKQQQNVFSFVGKIEGRIVAYGSLFIERTIRGGRLGYLEDIIVHPDNQGQGIGSAMVRHLIAIAKSEGCYKLVLSAKPASDAFYEFLGFESRSRSFELFLNGSRQKGVS